MNETIAQNCSTILNNVNLKKIKDKKILITGANGFLGQYITGALSIANRKYKLGLTIEAVGKSDPNEVIASLLKDDPATTYQKIDLTKPFDLARNYDYIFHTAGYGQPARFVIDPVGTIAIHVNATINLLDSNPEATFIFFSSAEIYGDIPREYIPVKESYNGNAPLHIPRSVYAEAKRLGEALCAAYVSNFGRKIKIVRISHTYGPGLPHNDTRVMSDFIRKALTEKKITMLDGGTSVKTYGYVADSVSMIIFIAFHGKEFVYNVGGKDDISVRELAEKISKILKVPCEIPKAKSQQKHVGKDPTIVKLNLSRIKKEMEGFSFTPFTKGLADTIEWTKDHISRLKTH